MRTQILWKLAPGFAGILAMAQLFAGAPAETDKTMPDHGGFQTCQPCHGEIYQAWEASGHSKAIGRISSAHTASSDCYGCHSTEGFAAKQKGEKIGPAPAGSFHTISCLACHNPRDSVLPKHLVLDRETLCSACHSQRAVLEGKGAKGIEDTRSFHSGVSCVSCHMSEGNHRMQVLRPDDARLPENRLDTCTQCHKDNNRKTRAKQLQDWQAGYAESMDPLQADLAKVENALKQKPDLLGADMRAKLADVRANLSIIQRDGSRGAHNLDYALEIMALAAKDLKEIQSTASIKGSR